jgi:hypothetical protein
MIDAKEEARLRDHIADSDLDNEQSIAITFRGTLGDIRNARKSLQCYRALAEDKNGKSS